MASPVPPAGNPNASPKHRLLEEQSEKKFNQPHSGSPDQAQRVAQSAAAAMAGAQHLPHRSPHNPMLPPLAPPRTGAAASPQIRSIF